MGPTRLGDVEQRVDPREGRARLVQGLVKHRVKKEGRGRRGEGKGWLRVGRTKVRSRDLLFLGPGGTDWCTSYMQREKGGRKGEEKEREEAEGRKRLD